MTNEFTVTIFHTKYGYAISIISIFQFFWHAQIYIYTSLVIHAFTESGANNFRSLSWITATRATSRFPFPFAVPLAIISPHPLPLPSFSLTAEELRGFKFAPLRGMQREIEIRGWYDKVIRKKRTAQNKRIIMYKEKKNPSQMNALETMIRDNVEMELV